MFQTKFTLFLLVVFFTFGCSNDNNPNITKDLNISKTKILETPKTVESKSNILVLTKHDLKPLELELKNRDTKEIIFKNYDQKIILLNFWSTICPPCRVEIPHLNELQKKYKNDLIILSVLLENMEAIQVETFIFNFEIQYPVTIGEKNFVLSEYMGNITAIPTMFLYDKEGKIFSKYVGLVPQEMIENDITRLLDK